MAIKPKITVRGVDDKDIVVERSYRDRKSDFIKTIENLGNKEPSAFIMGTLAIFSFIFPVYLYLFILLYLPIFFYRKYLVDRQRLPFRSPKIINRPDLGDPKPGRNAFAKAEGIFYVGTEKTSGLQLWLKLKDLLTHMLVFGTTGSGKTVFLLSQAFNAIAFGSGFIYIDPKGSPSLAFQIFYLARKLGRDDDYRLLNFNLGDLDLTKRTPKCMSNTMNPFAAPNTADSIIQMLSAVLPADSGSNSIFAQNGKTLIEGVTNALVSLREKKIAEMYPTSFVEALTPRASDELARNKNLDKIAKEHISKALTGLGWDEKSPFDRQGKNFSEQYSYARSYFTEITNKFTFSYGNIFNHKMGEIDMKDVILQRRIAVVILPSLGKSEKENKSIGQIVLSSVKQATAVGLGTKIEGKASDVLGSLPTDSPTPFLVITDEYAAISVEGYATVLTQGRSLGIAAIVASQDYGGIKKADEGGAKQIIANTKVKFFLKNEDPDDTMKLIKEIVGQGQVLKSSGYEKRDGSYIQRNELSYDMIDRVHARDLQEQTEGEFHALLNGELIRGDSFYADPPIKDNDELKIRILLSVLRPELSELKDFIEGQNNAEKVIKILLQGEKLDVFLPEEQQKFFDRILLNINKFSNTYDKVVSVMLSILSIQKEDNKLETNNKNNMDIYSGLLESEEDDDIIEEEIDENSLKDYDSEEYELNNHIENEIYELFEDINKEDISSFDNSNSSLVDKNYNNFDNDMSDEEDILEDNLFRIELEKRKQQILYKNKIIENKNENLFKNNIQSNKKIQNEKDMLDFVLKGEEDDEEED